MFIEFAYRKFTARCGWSPGLVEYNAWLRQDLMTQAVRSIAREGGYTHDLVDKGPAHLPDWASDTVDFVSQAEQYGRQHHTPARVIEVARPREVGKTARGALADCVFHGILPPIPQESCHPIHSKVAANSTGILPPIPRQSCHRSRGKIVTAHRSAATRSFLWVP